MTPSPLTSKERNGHPVSDSPGQPGAVTGCEPESTLDLARVLEDYLERLEQGGAPEPAVWLARYPGLTGPVDEYLAALDLLHRVALDSRGGPSAGSGCTSAEPDLARLGDYHLLREIARGGMGVVYEAEQQPLGRRVALKVLPLAGALDARQLRRFHTEAMTASLLHHPHIVDVFGAGCEGTVHYYAMRYIEGQTLAELITRMRIASGLETGGHEATNGPHASDTPVGHEPTAGPNADTRPDPVALHEFGPAVRLTAEGSTQGPDYVRAAVRIGAQVAEALDYAHEQGIIHRDVKPSNVILDADGEAWVTDFGLARVSQQAQLTQTGDLLGTLRYMSPEQALGKRGVLDHRTDVYSLGATLYELLTLRPAVPGDDHQEILRRIASEEPDRPSLLNRAVPPDLEAVVLKALASAPEERYATAGELADDLNRYLNNVPIRARLPTRREYAARWARRHRRPLLAVAFAALLMLTLAAVLLGVSNVRLREERERTAAERLETEKEKARAQEALGLEAEQRKRAEENAKLAIAVLEEIIMKEARQRFALYTQEEARGLPRTPEREKLEREFLQKGLKFYEQLARANATDWAARRERARAYANVALLQLDMKNFTESEKAYRQAVQLLEELAAERPGDVDNRFELAGTYHRFVVPYRETGRLEKAEELSRRAVAVFEQLGIDFPDHRLRARRSAAYCKRGLGEVLQKAGKPQEAEVAYRTALTYWEDPEAVDPAGPDSHPWQVGSNYLGLIDTLRQQGKQGQAEEICRRAQTNLMKFVAAIPDKPDYQLELAHLDWKLAQLLIESARLKEAEEEYRRAIGLLQDLVARNPAELFYAQELAHTHWLLAHLLKAAGRPQEAEIAYWEAVAIHDKLATDFPGVAEYRARLSRTLAELAENLRQQGKHAEAAKVADRIKGTSGKK